MPRKRKLPPGMGQRGKMYYAKVRHKSDEPPHDLAASVGPAGCFRDVFGYGVG